MRPDQGDIVLIPVPFTDLSTNKRRPVIVISNDAYHLRTSDVIVVAMTSNPARAPYSFVITAADLPSGTLNCPGTVRVDRTYNSLRITTRASSVASMNRRWSVSARYCIV
jgi:mRNA interferase MazF